MFHAATFMALRISIVVVTMLLVIGASLPVWTQSLPPTSAYRFRVERVTPAQGLSHSYVHSIMQDSRGFIWFGTRDGLNKYDGYRFTIYRPRPFDSSSLSVNVITLLAEDSSGAVWAGTGYHGLNRVDRVTERVRRYLHDPRNPRSISSNTILCLHCDRRGRLWIGTDSGLNRYDPTVDSFTRFHGDPDNPTALSHDSIEYIEEDPSGMLWIGSGGRFIDRFDPETGTISRFSTTRSISGQAGSVFIGDDPVAYRWAMRSAPLRNALLRVGKSLATDRLSSTERRFVRYGIGFDYHRIEPDGMLWIRGTPYHPGYSGLYLVSASDSSGEVADRRPEPIVAGNIWSLCRDRSGIYWVGTEDGVYRLVPTPKKVTTCRNDPLDPHSLSNSRIRSILKDTSGRLWVGTDEGLNRLDESGQGWIRYHDRPGSPRVPGSATVNVLFQDYDGRILIGTNGGVRAYDPEHDRLLPDYAPSRRRDHAAPIAVWSFYRDRSGNLWVGTKSDGIYIFDRRKSLVRHLRADPGDSLALSDDRVWCMAEDRRGNLWVGTNNGLNRWLPEQGAFRRYRHDARNPGSLCGDNVWCLTVDDSGTLWIGAYGGGVSRYDPSTDGFRSITTGDGLPSDAVYGILDDRQGRLWISTNNGLTLYAPQTGTFLRTYDASDGLQSNEFSFKAFFKASDGELFFGGLNGLSRFRPEEMLDNRHVPQLAVTSFRVFDRVVRHELFDGDRIEIPYNRNFISFEFTALDYANPGKNSYAYQLEGFDPEWILCGNRRYASYTNLDPGEYILRVKGSNNDNIWNERGIRLTIRILPPFWMTVWFRSALLLLLLSIVALLVRGRVRAIRRREQLGRRILESQLQALQAQMNPHFIFNALNSIHQLILDRCDEEASEYLAKFAHLVRLVLEHSRRQSITVADEVTYLTLYLELESMRFDGRLEYNVEVESSEALGRERIPSMLIQPYVENAIRHGLLPRPEGGTVSVRLRHEGEHILCTVEDNGIGRELALERRVKEGAHRPMGMLLTKQRLEILNAMRKTNIRVEILDLHCRDGRACGTRVDLHIPIEYDIPKGAFEHDTYDHC